MIECDYCGNDSPVTVTLNHVSFDTAPVSRMVSSLTVCLSCRSELKERDDVSW